MNNESITSNRHIIISLDSDQYTHAVLLKEPRYLLVAFAIATQNDQTARLDVQQIEWISAIENPEVQQLHDGFGWKLLEVLEFLTTVQLIYSGAEVKPDELEATA